MLYNDQICHKNIKMYVQKEFRTINPPPTHSLGLSPQKSFLDALAAPGVTLSKSEQHLLSFASLFKFVTFDIYQETQNNQEIETQKNENIGVS